MQNLKLARAGGEIASSLASSPPLREALLFTAGGLVAYALSLLAWLAVLVRYRLSYAYPLLALSYVLVYAGATQWPELAEAATPQRTVGTLLILAGVGLASLAGGRGSK
jgi:drug/metabolite transporter (DMT)-like permease